MIVREPGVVVDWETRRDAAFEDPRTQIEGDRRMEKIVQKVFDEVKENMPADTGIIEEIRCVNFMCHDKLTVKLGPLINFIIGHNGSGKSAVLTAITLCLGGKATATNRGQSLKSFIKEGRDFAILSVRIKNQGSAAYKPEQYGKSITVERHFTKSGASSFKIKNVKEKIVSTKKSDLEDILDAFALQLDNPMNVLTQDMARQFLNHSSPSDKYKFFIKGTQLETLDNDYRLMQDSIDIIESKLYTIQGDVDIYKKACREAQEKSRRADNLKSIRDKVAKYRRQMAWSQVAAEEQVFNILVLTCVFKKLDEIDLSIQKMDETIAQRTAAAEDVSRLFEDAEDAYNAAQTTLQTLQSELAPLEERCSAQQRDIRSEIESSDKTIKTLSKQIEDERQRQEAADGGQHAQKIAQIQEAKTEAEEASAAITIHRQGYQILEKELNDANRAFNAINPTLAEKQEHIKRSEGMIRNLTRDRGNWAAPYDSNLPNLLRAIQNEQRFRVPPVGPMGRHVQLLKPEWSSILEKQFGGSLNAFVVTSKADQNLLSELMRKTRCNSQIFIGSPIPIDTSRNEPDSQLDTWMRVLKIDNDLVRNQMIINQGIEKTVLISDRKTAMAFMFPDDNTRPHNVRMCFCMQDKTRREGLSLQYSAAGDPKTSPIHAYPHRPRMQTDTDAQLNFEKESLARYKQELSDLQSRIRESQSSVKLCQQAIVRHNKETSVLDLRRQRAEERAEQLKDELEAETPQAGQIDALEGLLHEAEESKQIAVNAYEDAVLAKDKLHEETTRLRHQLESFQDEVKEMNARITKAQTKTQKLADKRQNRLLEKNAAFESIKDAEDEKVEYERLREEQVGTVEEYIRQASVISSRVPIDKGESYDSLEEKYAKLQRDIVANERELGGTAEELADAALIAKEQMDTATRHLDGLTKLSQKLKYAMIERCERWKMFREKISSRARITFSYLLSERDFRGTLEISPMAKILDIKVEPDITKNSDKGRQTKTLSGGEKSFSTICLLLALWDAMGSPIRCLDEFDVFMDSVNRDVSMKMMIAAARRAVGRQYILITPQAMGNVELQGDVKIIKMSDPVRGQTTLPFAS
ncbi:putative DNA repair protein Rad18 [Lepidopterella palustris CBS 459.81]|uniref:Putative DNA repair protein Rad18 n=1 Tax=Lepidopterella palustris CBS 459.81 TaxID=1314670 RepID=A0A8E2EJ03_9PEZI|nr:putative DNA repair protein Rad18 [Lepidopterella palustris CBS 459.81]